MENIVIDPERWYTVREIAEIVPAGYFNILIWVKSGKLPAERRSDMFLVLGSDLLQTLARAKSGEIRLAMSRSSSVRKLVATK